MRCENRIALSCLDIVLCFFMWSHIWRVWGFSRDKKKWLFFTSNEFGEILCENWKICYWDIWNVEDSIRGRSHVQDSNVRMVETFQRGWTSVDDDPRSGRPLTSKTDDNVVNVREVIRSNRRLTVRGVAEEVSISKTVCHEILTEIWACNASQPNLCHACWRIKKSWRESRASGPS